MSKRIWAVLYHTSYNVDEAEGFIFATTRRGAERIAKQAGYDTRAVCETCGDNEYEVIECARARLHEGARILGGVL